MAGSWMRRLMPWLPVLGWMALISYWSGQSDLPIDQPALARLLRGEQHQLAHTAAFGILAVLLRWALGSMPRGGVVAWLIATAFGLLDEVHQAFTPGRAPDPQDLLVDSLAALAAAVAADAFVAGPVGRAGRVTRWKPSQFLAPVAVAALAGWCVLLLQPQSPWYARTARRAAGAVERRVPDSAERLLSGVVRRGIAAARAARDAIR